MKHYKLDNQHIMNFIGVKTKLLNKLKIDGDYKDVHIIDALDSPWKIHKNALIVDGVGYDTHVVGFGVTQDYTLCRMGSGEVIVLWNAERITT